MYSDAFFEPFLDTLRVWKDQTEVISQPWRNEFGVNDAGRLTLHGYPLHAHLEGRLLRFLLGTNIYKQDFWVSNPDLAAGAMNRAPSFTDAERVEVRVINGEAVYVTDLVKDYGHHLDFFEPMVTRFNAISRRSQTPLAMVGYLADPVWCHVRLVYVPFNSRRTSLLGLSFDANYLFSSVARGRASVALVAYDMRWESMLALDSLWCLRSAHLRTNTTVELARDFERRLDAGLPKARPAVLRQSRRFGAASRRNAPTAWRQRVSSEFGSSYIGKERSRSTLIDLDKRGLKNPVDFAFALSKPTAGYAFNRQVGAERTLADYLKEVLR
jgi:hypothetical protein